MTQLGQIMASPKVTAPHQGPWNFKNSKSTESWMSGPMKEKGPSTVKQKEVDKVPFTKVAHEIIAPTSFLKSHLK